MAIKETTNFVSITGVLVKHDLELKEVDKKDDKGNVGGKEDAIGGSIVVRTSDGSEHEITYFSKKAKKDGSGVSKVFTELENGMNNLKSLEKNPDCPDVVKIATAQFSAKDYKNKNDGEVKSYAEIKSNFIKVLTASEIEKTPQESKFEVEGVVETITEEVVKDVSTGNIRLMINVLGFEGTIIPVMCTVPKEIAEPFVGAGFYEGGYAKIIGRLVNTKEVTEEVEKMAFGQDNIKIVTKTIVRKEVTGGTPMGSPFEHGIEDNDYEQAKTKRKLKLDQIKNTESKPANSTPSVSNPFVSNATVSTPSFNPFAKTK